VLAAPAEKVHYCANGFMRSLSMPLRYRLFFLTFAIAVLSLSAPPRALAQTGSDEQPGYVPNADEEQLDPKWEKTVVFFRSAEAPGTVIVNTNERYLYVVQPGGRALRYGIGVGRDGFQWQGLVKITKKQEWPDWTPPPEMIQRQPYLPRWMAGGPGNPLGARALYLGHTEYRIHGTNMPQTIGTKVSSGCFRLTNPDVTDLYNRVPIGTKVIVLQRPQI
jgi:lipoprotein-anchoring transpeptidase ErfK/SrfK